MVDKFTVISPDALEVSNSGADGKFLQSNSAAGATWTDGDQLDVAWSPGNYLEDTSPSEASAITHLTAHLAGIANQLADVQKSKSLSTIGYANMWLSANQTTGLTTGSRLQFNRQTNGRGSIAVNDRGFFTLKANRPYLISINPRANVALPQTRDFWVLGVVSTAANLLDGNSNLVAFSSINDQNTVGGALQQYNVGQQSSVIYVPTASIQLYWRFLSGGTGGASAILSGQVGSWGSIIELPGRNVAQFNHITSQVATVGLKVSYVKTYFVGTDITVDGGNDDFTVARGYIYRARASFHLSANPTTESCEAEFRDGSGNPISTLTRYRDYGTSGHSNTNVEVAGMLVDARLAAQTFSYSIDAASGPNPDIGGGANAGSLHIEQIPNDLACAYLQLTSNQTSVGAGTRIILNNAKVVRGIPVKTNGSFTLKSGRAYSILAQLGFAAMTGNDVTWGIRRTNAPQTIAESPEVIVYRQNTVNLGTTSGMFMQFVLEVPEGFGGDHEFYVKSVASGTVTVESLYSYATIVELPSGDGDDVVSSELSGATRTTNATPKTIATYTSAGIANRNVTMDLLVMANDENTGNTDSGVFSITARFSVDEAGNINEEALTFTNGPDLTAGASAWAVTSSISGADISFQVAGDSGKNVQWVLAGTVIETENL